MNTRVKAGMIPLQSQRTGTAVPEALVTVFEDAITAIAIFDVKGMPLYANGVMRTLADSFGYPIANLRDLAPDDGTSAAAINFERFRAGKLATVRSRYPIHRSNGTLFWVDLSMSRYSFEPDQQPVIVIQIVDITAEYEAKRAEARWETALEAGRQGVWDRDAKLDTVTYSRMWRRLRGMADDEEVDGRRELWLERLHPEDRFRVESVVEKQETGEDGYDSFEYRERHRDGHYVWILSRGKPVEWDENGTPTRTIGTDTDITHLKNVEAELAQEKERLQVTLQSIADGVISTNAHGRITFINKAAERMTGWMHDDAMGQPIEIVFDSRIEGNEDALTASVDHCLKRGRAYRVSGYSLLKGKKSRTRYIRELASPVRMEDGSVIGAVMVFRDATQRRKLQRELEYSATHDPLTDLANRVAFETALDRSVQKAAATQNQHTLCLLDLDHFKAVNDGAGHSAGDALLQDIAKLLRASCRETDCVARLGGDEFGIILNNCNLKIAKRVTQKIIRKIAALSFDWQGEDFQIGASAGITTIDGTVGAAEIYRNADSACYTAKRNGRGCVVVNG